MSFWASSAGRLIGSLLRFRSGSGHLGESRPASGGPAPHSMRRRRSARSPCGCGVAARRRQLRRGLGQRGRSSATGLVAPADRVDDVQVYRVLTPGMPRDESVDLSARLLGAPVGQLVPVLIEQRLVVAELPQWWTVPESAKLGGGRAGERES